MLNMHILKKQQHILKSNKIGRDEKRAQGRVPATKNAPSPTRGKQHAANSGTIVRFTLRTPFVQHEPPYKDVPGIPLLAWLGVPGWLKHRKAPRSVSEGGVRWAKGPYSTVD